MREQPPLWCCDLKMRGMPCDCRTVSGVDYGTKPGDGLPVPTPPRHKRDDPSTSAASGEAMRGSKRLGDLQRRALGLVCTHPGLMAFELDKLDVTIEQAADPSRDHVRIARRLSELQRVGLIVARGEGRNEETRKPCVRWWSVDQGQG